jgi:hypothetical protein
VKRETLRLNFFESSSFYHLDLIACIFFIIVYIYLINKGEYGRSVFQKLRNCK